MRQICSTLCVAIVLVALIWFPPRVEAQTDQITTPGESELGNFELPGLGNVQVTQTTLAINGQEIFNSSKDEGPGATIDFVARKGGTNDHIIIQLSDGTVDVIQVKRELQFKIIDEHGSKVPSGFYSSTYPKTIGDAIYALAAGAAYVARDTLLTFQIDTTGLGSQFLWDIALDTAQNVWGASPGGLYRQAADSNTWNKVTTLANPPSGLFSVFVDRNNHIYASQNGGGSFVSTDGGTTWSRDSLGIGATGIFPAADDVFGNVYATGPNGTIYRSPGGTGTWTEIGQGIRDITVNIPNIRSLSGDTVLYAATSFGGFQSTDQGTTWTTSANEMNAENFYSFVKNTGGRVFISTALGAFYLDPPGTTWTKCLPTNGYQGLLQIRNDKKRDLFVQMPNLDPFSHNIGVVMKSTDNGVLWNPDTAGRSITTGTVWFVDETGRQHCASSFYGSSYYSYVYSKDTSGSWQYDTLGIPVGQYSYTSCFGGDRLGTIFISGEYVGAGSSPRVLSRPTVSGTWTVDTVGLPLTVSNFLTMKPGKPGEVFGSTGSALYRHAAGVWSAIPLPSTIIGGYTIDTNGTIFVARRELVGSTFAGVGISSSTDNGATWTALTHDTATVQVFDTFGDTSYALLQGGRLYKFTRNGLTAVENNGSDIPEKFSLEQNYPNPFNPSTRITYTVPSSQHVTIGVYDVLGREVAVLVDERKEPGTYTAVWNAAGFPSGAYFYRFRTDKFVQTKKLVLIR